MRQGNTFSQWIRHDDQTITIPLEVMEDLSDYTYIVWIQNKDGTYTLIPKKD